MPPKKVTLWDMLIYEAKQFCLNTTLHGYKFIVLPKRILLERFFWFTVVSISLATAVALLCIAWFNFQNSPTILVTDSTHHPIWNYPFPAITICNFNKFSKKSIYALAKKLERPYQMSVNELANSLRLLFQLMSNSNEKGSTRNSTRLQEILDLNEYTVEEVIKMVSPKCGDMLQRCKWKGEEKRCESMFEQIKTYEGYCCAFNYYALKNHTFGGLLPNKIPKMPRRVSACGFFTALEVLVDNQPEDYFASRIPAIGHKVIIHNSYDYPDWSVQSILTEQQINILIGITPSLTYSTHSIPSLPKSTRKCLFSNESDLHNFVNYNYHNCMTECRMNLTKQFCGCIPFFYYHETGTYPKTRICNLRDVLCLTEHRHLIQSSVPGYDFSTVSANHKWGEERHVCSDKCLPDCDYVDYSAEASSGIFTREFSTNQANLFGGVTIKHQSVVRVFFNDLVATKHRRDVIFSWHTLLAYYGGLLGLFIGFSFVSAFELIYYFTIRLAIDTKQRKEIVDRKKKDKNVVNVKPQEQILNPRLLAVNRHDRYNLRRRSNSNS